MYTRCLTSLLHRPVPVMLHNLPHRSLTTTRYIRSEASAEEKPTHPPSIAKEGTVLKGINVYTDRTDPVALKDSEYPWWLWTLLDKVPDEELSERLRLKKLRKEKIKADNYMRKKK